MADNFPANFPTTLDSYTTLVDNTDNVTANHPNARGSAIAAIEAKVGVGSSAVPTSHDYLFTHLPGQAANWDIGTFTLTALKFTSDQATGTAPFTVASTTVVTDLNSDTTDGKHVAGTNGAGEITTNDGTQTLTNKTLTSPTLTTPTITSGLAAAQGGTGSTAAANAASGVVVLNASSQLPAVDGSLITGIVTGRQLFTSTGTFTTPTGISFVFVSMVGGGGGGGGGGSSVWEGSGGGSGAYVIRQATTVVAGSGYTVTVGAAGTAGAYQGHGGNGGNSSFAGANITITCNGGKGGEDARGTAGVGGTASGTAFNATTEGVGGGVGLTSVGGNGSAVSSSITGGGGGSPFGVGGQGVGADTDGLVGTGYGCGGSGGSHTNKIGGAGKAGMVYIEW